MLQKIKFLIIILLFFPIRISAGWQSEVTGSFEKMKSGITEIQESFDETREFISSVNRFVSTISAAAGAVTTFVGGKSIVLLFSVLFLSSGFGAIGLPPGRYTFFPALITADVLWLVWVNSIRAEIIPYSFMILKTNLIILAPLFLYLAFVKFFPTLYHKFRSIILKSNDGSISTVEAGHLLSMLNLYSIDLMKKISEDIEKGREFGRVTLSADTRNSLRQMKELTEKFPE